MLTRLTSETLPMGNYWMPLIWKCCQILPVSAQQCVWSKEPTRSLEVSKNWGSKPRNRLFLWGNEWTFVLSEPWDTGSNGSPIWPHLRPTTSTSLVGTPKSSVTPRPLCPTAPMEWACGLAVEGWSIFVGTYSNGDKLRTRIPWKMMAFYHTLLVDVGS